MMIDLIEEIDPPGVWSKSIGECSVVPAASAVANAISNAVRMRIQRPAITRSA
jgi:CO/xanthine dehydrogenase Mo-binding subunit